MVKENLKAWNKSDYGNIDDNISSLEQEIQKWDLLSNDRDLSESEIKEKATAQWELWEWLEKKRLYGPKNLESSG